MQHIDHLLTKIKGLTDKENITLLDIDLMMEHTRAVYAALIEKRNELAIIPMQPEPATEKKEPTLNEYVATIAEEPIEHETRHELSYMEIEEEMEEAYEEQVAEKDDEAILMNTHELSFEEPEPIKIIVEDEPIHEQEEAAQPVDNATTDRITLELPHIPAAPLAPHKIHDTDIRHKISINDKYQFISELFGNNKEAYEEVLNELNSFETYADGVKWLQSSVYTVYNWHEENETLQMFYGMLERFYGTY